MEVKAMYDSIENLVNDFSDDEFSKLVESVNKRLKDSDYNEQFKALLELVGCWFITSVKPADEISREMSSGLENYHRIEKFCKKFPGKGLVITLDDPVLIEKAFGTRTHPFGECGGSFDYEPGFISKIESMMSLEQWRTDPFRKYFLENGGYEQMGSIFINHPNKGLSLKAFQDFWMYK